MTKIAITVLFVLALLALAPAMAAENGAESEPFVSASLTTNVLDSYLGANGSVFYAEPVLQPDLFLAFKNCWHVDVWASAGEGEWWDNFGSEVDLTVGKCVKFGELSLDVNVAYFAIVDAGVGLADIVNPYVELARPVGPVRMYLKLEHYFPVEGSAPAKGSFVRLGVSDSLTLSKRVTASLGTEVFWDSGAFGFSEGYLAKGSADLLFAVGPKFAFGPMVKMATPLSSLADGRTTEVAWGIKVVQKF